MRTQDAQVLVLRALADGPLHGYAINAVIEKLTGNRLGAGSLYGALTRLETKQLVEHVAGSGRQRPVRLTATGREMLDRELRSMARMSGSIFETAVPGPVGYLDRVAATDAARAYKKVMADALAARPGQTVLDVGCGPGTDLRAVAEAVSPTGTVIGLDADPEMIETARERTADLPRVKVRQGDVHALDLDDDTVDGARTDRVLQNVTDPVKALAELLRVLRPGGRLVTGEPDWDSLAIDYPDLEVSRSYTRHLTDRIVRNGVIGRQLARLATATGFVVSQVVPVTTVFRDVESADQILGLQRNTERAVAAGYLTTRDAQRWLAHLADEPFLAAVTLYVVVAEAT
ncbi:methyltransferase domain-containing protein [Polymorphospora sp. NPDC050346]|uniref:methyltransferase domain-containing protein n=1 Tax=Polymorphospora sp. NPDC050346 TaxID=3155780 RepID=UPI0034105136